VTPEPTTIAGKRATTDATETADDGEDAADVRDRTTADATETADDGEDAADVRERTTAEATETADEGEDNSRPGTAERTQHDTPSGYVNLQFTQPVCPRGSRI
jgi:hypothetical protein